VTSALPAEFNTVQVYGTYVNLDGTPAVGYLTFEASPVILRAGLSKDLIVPVVLQVNLDGSGYFSINLPATDDPDINPGDWTYKVTEGFGSRRVYNIAVHVAQAPSVNIFDLAPMEIASGTFYLQGETGPQGPPGADGAPGAPGTNGTDGAPGAPGQGVPVGGTSGQVLSKNSATDYDTAWTTLVIPPASPVSLTGRPVNVFNTGTTQADAVGDGTLHPLSERFASLTAAQAVFPTATALTQSIDALALQTALNNNSVVEGRIDKKLVIDSTVFANVSGYQTVANMYMLHKPSTTAITMFSSGNIRGGVANVSSPTNAEAPEYFGLTLRNIIVDGNRHNGLTGSVTPLYLVHCSDLVVEDFEVRAAQGNGFSHFGCSDAYAQRQTYRRVKVVDCNGTYGFRNSLRTRKVRYDDLAAVNNVTHGIYFDHSEAQTSNILAANNGSHGIWINNVFGGSYTGFRATENGHHGIYVLGLTDSQGADWVSLNNGTASTGYSDVYFTATAQSYGVTKNASIRNLTVGRTSNSNFGDGALAGEDYGLYVEDGVTTDVDIEVRHLATSGLGFSRLPASMGTLAVRETKPGTARAITKLTVVTMTAAAYAALATKDANTLYVIAG